MAPAVAGVRSPLLLPVCDAAAIAIFVTIGLVTHHRGLSAAGYARDTLPLAAGWFGAAALFHLYGDNGLRALLATWALGIPAGVLVRALVLGHSLNGGEAAFLGVCLVVIGLLVGVLRGALLLTQGERLRT